MGKQIIRLRIVICLFNRTYLHKIVVGFSIERACLEEKFEYWDQQEAEGTKKAIELFRSLGEKHRENQKLTVRRRPTAQRKR